MGAQRGWSTPCLLLLLSFHCQGRLYCSAVALFGKAGTLTFLVLIPFFPCQQAGEAVSGIMDEQTRRL